MKQFAMLVMDRFVLSYLDRRRREILGARGHRMAIIANEFLGDRITVKGAFDEKLLQAIFSFMSGLGVDTTKSVALDVGANVGAYTVQLARHFIHVHSFELDPSVAKLLEFNTNAVGNATAHPFGLSDKSEEVLIYGTEMDSSVSALDAVKEDFKVRSRGEVRALDELVFPEARLALIKIDVEGAESKVLMGSQKTLRANWPIIIMEQNRRDFREGSTAAIDILAGMGYEFFWFEHLQLARERPFTNAIWRIWRALTGSGYRLITGDAVPSISHPLLVCVPKRMLK